MSDAELIRAAIAASGLSARKFAEAVTWRDERTIRRWGAGEIIPQTARERLEWFLSLSDMKRRRLVTIATWEPRR